MGGVTRCCTGFEQIEYAAARAGGCDSLGEGQVIRILLAASEVIGFAKTGGLADVAGSLPRALARLGLDCAIIMPLYRCARSAAPMQPTQHLLQIPIGGSTLQGRLWRSQLPGSSVPVYLVEQDDFFGRDDPAHRRGLYQSTDSSGVKRDYTDNASRFVFFCRAVLESCRLLDFWPDVLHVNDWQTGLVPVFLREEYAKLPDAALRESYSRIKTLLTIHNIAYQGNFWHWDIKLTELDWSLFNPDRLEFHGNLSFLKAGLVYADFINTVSPTYAREIQTPYFGCGLQGLLTSRQRRLIGIVNGVDYGVWDPALDPYLPANYSVENPEPGKSKCKDALQRTMGLDADPRSPLLGVVARLVEQKGVELICQAMPALIGMGAQFAILGEGDPHWHYVLQELRDGFRTGSAFASDSAKRWRIRSKQGPIFFSCRVSMSPRDSINFTA